MSTEIELKSISQSISVLTDTGAGNHRIIYIKPKPGIYSGLHAKAQKAQKQYHYPLF